MLLRGNARTYILRLPTTHTQTLALLSYFMPNSTKTDGGDAAAASTQRPSIFSNRQGHNKRGYIHMLTTAVAFNCVLRKRASARTIR